MSTLGYEEEEGGRRGGGGIGEGQGVGAIMGYEADRSRKWWDLEKDMDGRLMV
jgi:hypothetical protein